MAFADTAPDSLVAPSCGRTAAILDTVARPLLLARSRGQQATGRMANVVFELLFCVLKRPHIRPNPTGGRAPTNAQAKCLGRPQVTIRATPARDGGKQGLVSRMTMMCAPTWGAAVKSLAGLEPGFWS